MPEIAVFQDFASEALEHLWMPAQGVAPGTVIIVPTVMGITDLDPLAGTIAAYGTFAAGYLETGCSGVMISPHLFLTAAHCNVGTTRVYVTFDPIYSSKSKLHAGFRSLTVS